MGKQKRKIKNEEKNWENYSTEKKKKKKSLKGNKKLGDKKMGKQKKNWKLKKIMKIDKKNPKLEIKNSIEKLFLTYGKTEKKN